MATRPPQKSADRPKYTHSLRDFKGVNTQAARQNIQDDQFAWLENLFPLGYGNLQAIPGPSLTLGSWPTGTATFFESFNLNYIPILIVFTNTGGGYSVDLETNAVTQFATDGTFSTTGTYATMWSDTDVLIIDSVNGYYTYDGTTLTKITGTIQDVTITTPGSGFTSPPTITIAAPGSGTTATATADLQLVLATISAAGTNYEIGDTLTIVGGTFNTAAELQVSATGSGGTITGFNISLTGDYTAVPSNPASVTGGFGSGATFTLNWGVGPVTLTDPGSGYITDPAVTVSGGGGTGATLVANVNVAPSSGTAIATYSGRVWISNGNRTISFSAPGSFTDFTEANGGGSFVITDSTLLNIITGLYSANSYLYIFGKTCITVVSGVQVVSGVTTFSQTNISASIGTNEYTSIVPYYRGLAFATPYGFYILNGTTCQKISSDLDGYFNSITSNIQVSGGYFNLSNNICLGFLTSTSGNQYANYPRSLLAIFFDKKWTFSSQGDNLTLCTTALYNGNPVLYGTDGTNFYSLMTNPDNLGSYTFLFQHLAVSKLWPMEDPIRHKQALKFGLEANTFGEIDMQPVVGIVDSEVPTNYQLWDFTLNPIGASGYCFSGTDIETYGKYIGFQSTDQFPGLTFSAFHLQYELVSADWISLPPSTPPAPVFPTPPSSGGSPGEVLYASGGINQTFETWLLAPGATSYNLYWSLTPGAGTSGTLISGITATSYNHTGLLADTTYYYVVTAVNAGGQSAPSNQAAATTLGFPSFYAGALVGFGTVLFQYERVGGGQLDPNVPAYLTTANETVSIAVAPNGLLVYVGSTTQSLYAYSRNFNTGALTYISTISITGTNGICAFSPSGEYLYVINSSGALLESYLVNSNGSLTPTGSAATDFSPEGIFFDSTGAYVYVATGGPINQYEIIANGVPSPLSPADISVPGGISSFSVAGSNVFSTGTSSGGYYTFEIAPNGTLTNLGPTTVAALEGSVVTTSGEYVYFFTATEIYQFKNLGGVLSPLTPATVTVGSSLKTLQVSRDGSYLYAVDGSPTIYEFSIGSDGTLTPLSPASITIPYSAGVTCAASYL